MRNNQVAVMSFPAIANHPWTYPKCVHNLTWQRLLLEISILLTGKKHEPPGTTPPWLQQGGKEAAAAARYGKGADMLVGVGGEGVPNARVSIDRSTPREPVKRHFLNVSHDTGWDR